MATDSTTINTRTTEFMVKVESAWFERMKGDLALVPDEDNLIPHDAELAYIVSRLAAYAQDAIAMTGSAQVDANGDDLPDSLVSEEEMARRIAVALESVLYGGVS